MLIRIVGRLEITHIYNTNKLGPTFYFLEIIYEILYTLNNDFIHRLYKIFTNEGSKGNKKAWRHTNNNFIQRIPGLQSVLIMFSFGELWTIISTFNRLGDLHPLDHSIIHLKNLFQYNYGTRCYGILRFVTSRKHLNVTRLKLSKSIYIYIMY